MHNKILKRRPDLLRELYGEFHSDVRGEATRKRHLLRLWPRTPGYRELPPYLDRRFEYFETWSRNGPRVEALG